MTTATNSTFLDPALTPESSGRELVILIDGKCPLCKHEAHLLMRLDGGRGRLGMLDITDPTFDPARYGLDHPAVNRYIHAVDGEGRVITGLEVFRRAYGLVGWGWLWAPTGWPGLRRVFNALYRWFAKNRHRLTFRRDVPPGACAIRE